MQPAQKKIKLDWPALVQNYPTNANIFRCDEDAQYEVYKILQTVPELRNKAIAILQAEMQEPFIGMDEYFLQDANPTKESCALLFSKCTLQKRQMLIKMLHKHQNNLEMAQLIMEAFMYPITKWCDALCAVLAAILQQFPRFIICISQLCENTANVNGPDLPQCLLKLLPLVRGYNDYFFCWMGCANSVISKRTDFDHDMDELVIQLSNRVCIGDMAAMTLFIQTVKNLWPTLATRIAVHESVVRALFYCYEDEQKHVNLQEQPVSIEMVGNLPIYKEFVVEYKSLDLLWHKIGYQITDLYMPKIIQDGFNHGENLHLFVRTLCYSRHDSNLALKQYVLSKLPFIVNVSNSLKLGLCIVDWDRHVNLKYLHSSVVQWLRESKGNLKYNKLML